MYKIWQTKYGGPPSKLNSYRPISTCQARTVSYSVFLKANSIPSIRAHMSPGYCNFRKTKTSILIQYRLVMIAAYLGTIASNELYALKLFFSCRTIYRIKILHFVFYLIHGWHDELKTIRKWPKIFYLENCLRKDCHTCLQCAKR